jgi:hypothetical protein
MLLYKLGRFLQVVGMILLPVAIAGNASDRTSFKTFLIVAAIGVVVFTVGWLIQEAGRPK